MEKDEMEDPPAKRCKRSSENCVGSNRNAEEKNKNGNCKHKIIEKEFESKRTDESHQQLQDKDKQEGTSKTFFANHNDYAKEGTSKSYPMANDKYENYVTPEELEKLKEFQVLDEVKSNDEDSNEDDSDSSEGVPEDEIEKMLDEELPEELRGSPKQKQKPFVTRQKIVLEEKGVNQFEVLPLDWMVARHYSGMPVYMHRTTRVCTLAKPYFLGKGNTRRHEIPISAIPCLAYRRALEEEEKQRELDKQIEEQIRNGTWKTNDINKATNTFKCPFLQKVNAKKAKTTEVIQTNANCNGDNATNDAKVDSSVDKETTVSISGGTDDSNSIIKDLESLKANEDTVNMNEINKTAECDVTSSSQEKDLANKTDITQSIEKDSIDSKIETEISNEIIANDKAKSIDGNDIVNVENSNKEIDESVTVTGTVTSEKSEENNAGSSKEGDTNGVPKVKPVVLPGGIVMPPPRVETVSTSWKTQHLTPEQVNDYCKKLFRFKIVNIMHFKRWADRRKYTKARKTLQYPTLPEGTKLITIPAHVGNGTDKPGSKATKRDWVMDMNGRSYLSVFHEYVRQALEKQPVYEFKQLENASTPYQATVYIGGMQYGVGQGSSKRAAKAAAARASIRVLIPEMATDLDPPQQDDPNEPDFSFFDYVGIEDPRISEFCAATCEPSPHAILRTCLLRNFGAGDRHINMTMEKLEYQKIKLTMTVGKHTSTVVCKNKKTAKQRASQAILQMLHPHVRSWGSLLRLYGSRSVKSCKEKKEEEQQITLLQDAARQNEPNYAVLEKLRNEMRKLRERDAAVVPIGTLLVKDDLPTHSGSNLNNVDL